jgi:hypothetical protein
VEKDELEQRKSTIKDTLCCPYCGEKLKRWAVPQSIFTEWPNEYLYICFNDNCSYFIDGWGQMANLGRNCSYRLMYDPLINSCSPFPVVSSSMLKDDIMEDE